MILIFAAHPDDEVLGCGGTIAKFSQKREKVVSVVFSYGEKSNPLLDPKFLTDKRKKESEKACKILGTNEILFLGVEDKPFSNGIGKDLDDELKKIIKKYKPEVIFTHCIDDPHPLHRAVARKVKQLVNKLNVNAQVYTFETGGLFRFVHRNQPKLYIDISDVIEQKKQALAQFDVIHEGLFYYRTLVLLKNRIAGMKIKKKYAEVFYSW